MDKFGWVGVVVMLIECVYILTCSQNYLGQPRECCYNVSFFMYLIHDPLTGFCVCFTWFCFSKLSCDILLRLILTSWAQVIVPTRFPE